MASKRKPAAIDERVTPHNLEAERAVLGACLINPASFDRATEVLRADDFFRRAHAIVWRAMLAIVERRAGIDTVTLRAEVERMGEMDEVGGPAYIAGLTDGVPRSTNALHYATLVKGEAQRRHLIALSNTVLEDAYARERPVADLVAYADRRIIDIAHGVAGDSVVALHERVDGIWKDLEVRANRPAGTLTGVDTGFASINADTGGWQNGDMIVIAARPSMGKTAFTLNTCTAAAKAGRSVVLFSLEMRREQLEYRLLASLAGVDLSRLQSGQLGEVDYENVARAMGELGQLRIGVDDRSSVTAWDIRAVCRRLKAEGKLDLVIIDYIQLMGSSDDRFSDNRNAIVSDISRRTKVLAGELNVPIIVLSQLNRNADGRADSKPRLSDLRESGSLEQDADLVCFLHRKDHRASGNTAFIIEKQRNGPTGTYMLSINRPTQTFTDGGEPEPEPPADEKPVKKARGPRPFRAK